jgi:ATP-dependent DNA helicase 2 subunit 2
VTNNYKYQIKDESQAGGVRDVERDELAKGYEYGRTAVAISETEQNITKLETNAAYEILGFIPAENVERYMLLDNTNMLVAQKGNDKAAIALSSMVHALFELDSVAVARLVKKDMAEPILTILSPLVQEDIDCLIEDILPFAEDLRSYRFPPLDKVLTVSGKELTEHRNLPSKDLLKGMSDYVDSMSLVDDEEEQMAMEDTFSPVLHTIEGAIKYRAVHPDKELPPKPPAFEAYKTPPEDLQEQSKKALAKLMSVADVKKVPARAKGRRRYRETEKPLSGLNVADLFRTEKRDDISPDNAIPEFKQKCDNTTDMQVVQRAVKQMTKIFEDQISSSFGSQSYDRVIEGLGVVREYTVGLEVPDY